jgi:excisionase family DNA binding protein
MTARITFSRIGAHQLRVNATVDIQVTGLDEIWPHLVPGDTAARVRIGESSHGSDSQHLLTVEETAELLHLGRDKIYYLMRTGQLRSIKIGNSPRISRSWITEFIERTETRRHDAQSTDSRTPGSRQSRPPASPEPPGQPNDPASCGAMRRVNSAE